MVFGTGTTRACVQQAGMRPVSATMTRRRCIVVISGSPPSTRISLLRPEQSRAFPRGSLSMSLVSCSVSRCGPSRERTEHGGWSGTDGSGGGASGHMIFWRCCEKAVGSGWGLARLSLPWRRVLRDTRESRSCLALSSFCCMNLTRFFWPKDFPQFSAFYHADSFHLVHKNFTTPREILYRKIAQLLDTSLVKTARETGRWSKD